MGRTIAVVGLQYGSEGKGHVAHLLASLCQLAIRTGGANAGHTLCHRGVTFKLRQVPCAAVNPGCLLVIGPGGLIDPAVLQQETTLLERAGHPLAGRLFVHENAGLVEPRHADLEARAALRERLGSTAQGIGAATAERALRTLRTVRDHPELLPACATPLGTHAYLDLVHGLYEAGGTIMLEGTQGSLLSLYHGPYPYVTSRDVTAASLAGAAGIAPGMVDHVVGVARAFPIRAAGDSGPLPFETSFEALGRPPEQSTVTHRVRRIARFDPVRFRAAVRLNRPTVLALTFADYLDPQDRPLFVAMVERLAGLTVDYVGLGPVSASWRRPGSLFDLAWERWQEAGGVDPSGCPPAPDSTPAPGPAGG